MANEVKEIIKYLENPNFYLEDFGFSYKRISLDETNILLNYITNLQKENTQLNKIIDGLEKYIKAMIKEDKKYSDIASRYGVLNWKYILDKLKELKEEGKE